MQSDIDSAAGDFFAFKDVGSLASTLVGAAITISGIIALLLLVWGGIRYMTSAGEKAEVENAQKVITNALIGLAIVATSWAVFTLLKSFFGLDESLITR